jgi:hypothetical protein
MGIIEKLKGLFGSENVTLAEAEAATPSGRTAGIKDIAGRYGLERRKSPIDFFASGLEKYGWLGSYHGLPLEVHELRVMEFYLGEIWGGVLVGLRRVGPDAPLPPPDSPQRLDTLVGEAGRDAARQFFFSPAPLPDQHPEFQLPEVLAALSSLSASAGALLFYGRGVQLNVARKQVNLDALDRDLDRAATIVAALQRLNQPRAR